MITWSPSGATGGAGRQDQGLHRDVVGDIVDKAGDVEVEHGCRANAVRLRNSSSISGFSWRTGRPVEIAVLSAVEPMKAPAAGDVGKGDFIAVPRQVLPCPGL